METTWCNFSFTLIFINPLNNESVKGSFRTESIKYKLEKSWIESNPRTTFFFNHTCKVNIFGPPFDQNLHTGRVCTVNNKIFFLSDAPDYIKFTLFDFNLRKGEVIENEYIRILKLEHEIFPEKLKFKLSLDLKFYDPFLCDTIYKFKIYGFKLYSPTNYFINFIGKNTGVVGYYTGDKRPTDSTEIILGSLHGNVYKNIFDYSKVVFRCIM